MTFLLLLQSESTTDYSTTDTYTKKKFEEVEFIKNLQ